MHHNTLFWFKRRIHVQTIPTILCSIQEENTCPWITTKHSWWSLETNTHIGLIMRKHFPLLPKWHCSYYIDNPNFSVLFFFLSECEECILVWRNQHVSSSRVIWDHKMVMFVSYVIVFSMDWNSPRELGLRNYVKLVSSSILLSSYSSNMDYYSPCLRWWRSSLYRLWYNIHQLQHFIHSSFHMKDLGPLTSFFCVQSS